MRTRPRLQERKTQMYARSVAAITTALMVGAGVASAAPAAKKKEGPTRAAIASTPRRTPDGQPDLQGVWANTPFTPLQRPPQWAGKQTLNEQEIAALKKAAADAVADDSDAVFGDSLV